MKNGWVQAVFVGCDRVAAMERANKIGTSGVAILAKHYGIPFYVCAPTSTIDYNTPTGDGIHIEQRAPEEVTEMWYKERMAPQGVKVYNPAFDVTDHSLITAIVTEYGIARLPIRNPCRKSVRSAGGELHGESRKGAERKLRILAVADLAVQGYPREKILENASVPCSMDILPWKEYYPAMMESFQGRRDYDIVMVAGHLWLKELADQGFLAPVDEPEADLLPGLRHDLCYENTWYLVPSFLMDISSSIGGNWQKRPGRWS